MALFGFGDIISQTPSLSEYLACTLKLLAEIHI